MTSAQKVTLVDCTLRDGGYYNDWDYSADLIRRYVDSMERARVDVIEMGFRRFGADRYLGPTAFTTDEFLSGLNIAPERTVAVMMNAKDIVSAADPVAAVRQVFAAKANSRVDMVRFAALYKEVEPLAPAIDELHRMGYRVALNMMQVSDRTPAEIVDFGRKCKSMGVEVAYIADSFGGLRPSDLPPIIHSLLEGFEGPVEIADVQRRRRPHRGGERLTPAGLHPAQQVERLGEGGEPCGHLTRRDQAAPQRRLGLQQADLVDGNVELVVPLVQDEQEFLGLPVHHDAVQALVLADAMPGVHHEVAGDVGPGHAQVAGGRQQVGETTGVGQLQGDAGVRGSGRGAVVGLEQPEGGHTADPALAQMRQRGTTRSGCHHDQRRLYIPNEGSVSHHFHAQVHS